MEPEWDNRWHTIGLNWIDRNSQAHIIYELYLCVLQPFLVALEQRLRALLVPPYIINFFIQLFTKSTTEILYCLLIKHNNKDDLSTYRLEEEMRYKFTSILSEVMVSLLTTCLTEGCTGKLESIHVSAGDLFCPVCKTQYEVKSKSRLYPGSVTTFKAGTPPGIYNLIYGSANPANPAQRGPPGRMLVIATNACELFEVSPLMARSVTVEGHPIRDRAGPWNLDDFSHFFREYPGRSFREYETTLSVQPGQLASIPLTGAAIAQLGELRSHLKFKILGKMLFDFQNDFRQAVFAKGLRFLEMQGELSEARPQVILINENNLLDLKSMEEEMTKLEEKCSKIIDCRIPRPEPGGAGAAVWGSHRDSASSINSGTVAGTLLWYDPKNKKGLYSYNNSKKVFTFDLRKNQKFQNQGVTMTFKDGNLTSVFLTGGGNINNIYLKMNEKNEEMYKEKYLKYKNKYIQLKSLLNTN